MKLIQIGCGLEVGLIWRNCQLPLAVGFCPGVGHVAIARMFFGSSRPSGTEIIALTFPSAEALG
jgi:ABC-type uncharacterized transport system permease subunit